MSDFDREEAAFRAAFAAHGASSPGPPPQIHPSRASRRFAPFLVAAMVATVIGGTVAVLSDDERTKTPLAGPERDALGVAPQWIGLRGVEVQAPGPWAVDTPAIRPDCIQDEPTAGQDFWAGDVPRAPYVSIGGGDRPVRAIGCFSDPQPWDPNPAFGALPFRLWQPYVALEIARPDLATQQADRRDGEYAYAGWTLTRATIAGVQISVLATPADPGLGRAVLDSAKQVTTTHDGCAVDSPVLAGREERPTGASVPTVGVASVTICDYSRNNNGTGLSGSRRVTGAAAQDLVDAFHDAPAGVGPEGAADCQEDGGEVEQALVLRVFGPGSRKPLADAYVYFDSCVGNAIVDSEGPRQLTRENCSPLFSTPPIEMGSAWSPVYRRCAVLAGHG